MGYLMSFSLGLSRTSWVSGSYHWSGLFFLFLLALILVEVLVDLVLLVDLLLRVVHENFPLRFEALFSCTSIGSRTYGTARTVTV